MPLPPDQPERRKGAATEVMAANDRLARWLKIAGLSLVVYAAFIVTAASVIGIINSFQSVEQARKATTFAKEAKTQAKLAKDQAKLNASVAKSIEILIQRQAPCLEGDPPDSPACETKARTDKLVGDAIARMIQSVDTHDITATKAHDAIQSTITRRPVTTTRTPITAAPRTTDPRTTAPRPMAATPTTAPRPTTTTTCPTKGRSNKCR